MKKLLSTKPGKLLLALALFAFAFLVILVVKGQPFALEILLALVITGALWIGIDLGFKAWQRRRQAGFDARMAAREGIEDRRREWAEWTAELRRQGIDRYQLPMYLLVGEPQSGKSIMLRNSDLHFPFGQNRLSGVGGTKGCDWWFTDQAVILDLAGRLFTHEGGASDEAEWAAFLELLANYRPQCPANGVILVLPCDALASDAEAQVAKKAAKMQAALLTLTNKLQARLPVYVVLTKADKIFGFAECVHRLDAEKRQEIFGWSRALEKLEAPFDLAEAQTGFQGVLERARLLRSQMLATARIPEALSEVDRFYAFPDELGALWPSLGLYLQRVFSESRLIDMLFFRGVYLTSGLQSGAPIAKVCAELMGSTGEADRRSLEGLFTKQRAYFIKDLVRERIFTEQGLVRPTRQRVVHARRNALVAYSIVAISAFGSVGWAAWRLGDEYKKKPKAVEIVETLEDALEGSDLQEKVDVFKRASASNETLVQELGLAFGEKQLMPELSKPAVDGFTDGPLPTGYAEFERHLGLATAILAGDEIDEANWKLAKQLIESRAEVSDLDALDEQSGKRISVDAVARKAIVSRVDRLWEGALDPGSGWAMPGALGLHLASKVDLRTLPDDCTAASRFLNVLNLAFESMSLARLEEKGQAIRAEEAADQLDVLEALHEEYATAAGASVGELRPLSSLRKEIEGKESLPIDKSVKEMLDSEELKKVTPPSFLALDDLSRLSDDLRAKIKPETLAAKLFQIKARCVGIEYQRKFPKDRLDALQSQLSTAETVAAFDPDLSAHLGGLYTAIAALGGTDLPEWKAHVAELIDAYETRLLNDWSLHPAGLEHQLRQHFEHISPAIETQAHQRWLGDMLDLLVRDLGTVQAAVKRFLEFSDLPELEASTYVRQLESTAASLREEGDPAGSSGRLLDARAGGKAPENGTGRVVDVLFAAVCELTLRDQVRPAFLQELEGRIGPKGTHRSMVEALWSPGSRSKPDFTFFDRGGALDALLEKYRVERAAIAGEDDTTKPKKPRWKIEEFAEPGEDRWDAVVFLRAFQGFLLSNDQDQKAVVGKKIPYVLDGDPNSEVFRDRVRENFYVASGASRKYCSTANLQRLALEWKLEPESLELRWSEASRQSVKDENDLTVTYSGWFAPMEMAWSGALTPDGWRVPVSLSSTKGAKHQGVVYLLFDPQLPERPKAMPFP